MPMARFLVRGNSMEPALEWGQRLLVSRVAYRIRGPKSGELVIVRHPSRPQLLLVKRVVGVPGDDVRLESGVLKVNDTTVAVASSALFEAHWHLDEGAYFVKGDRSDGSADSRTFGPVNRSMLIGKVWLSYWPPHRWGLPRRSLVLR